MVLNYYIATQTVEEHLRFVFVTFFYHWFFLLFLKNKMQHIPATSRWTGTENVGRGPCFTDNWLIPSTGLVYLQREQACRIREWRGEVKGKETEVSHCFQRRKK